MPVISTLNNMNNATTYAPEWKSLSNMKTVFLGSDIAAAHLINFSNLIIHISRNLSYNIWHHALSGHFKASATKYAIIKVSESLYVTMYNLSFHLKIA